MNNLSDMRFVGHALTAEEIRLQFLADAYPEEVAQGFTVVGGKHGGEGWLQLGNDWHHFAVAREGRTYLDGVEVAAMREP